MMFLSKKLGEMNPVLVIQEKNISTVTDLYNTVKKIIAKIEKIKKIIKYFLK